MIKTSRKTTAPDVPTMNIPPKDVRPAKPTVDDPLDTKIAYVVYRATHDIDPMSFTGENKNRELQQGKLRVEVQELAQGDNQLFAMAIAVNQHVYETVGIKTSQIPQAALVKYFDELERDQFFLGSELRQSLRHLVTSSTNIYCSPDTLRDLMMDRVVFPMTNPYAPTLSLIVPTFMREGQMYEELRNGIWQGYSANNPPQSAKAYRDFLMMLESPYCLQPRTVQIMHVMLLQSTTGLLLRYSSEEKVPDSVLRRHYADQTYTLRHTDIVELWRHFLNVCQDMQQRRRSVFTNLPFTEFLCTGKVTAAMVMEIESTSKYALMRLATVIALFSLGEKSGHPAFQNDDYDPMVIRF